MRWSQFSPNSLRVHALGVGIILGLLLWVYGPTLRDGLFADDFVAMAIMDGTFAAKRSQLDLFDFANGTPEDVRALRRLGSLPWWAPTDYRISFMRPLSSALWHADRVLFGDAYGAYHAHSLAVFFALVISASFLYRRLFSGVVALLATLVFAIDDCHRFPVVWLSNRGGIYALLFGVLALLAHLRFREQGRWGFAAASAVSTSVGLMFGEWGLPMVAYVVAYEVAAASGPLRRRALALVPVLVPSLLFIAVRAWLHYGARGSGAYVDPAAEPARFLFSVLHRVPVFFADMVWNVPCEWWDHGTPWRDALLRTWFIPPNLWAQLPGWRFAHFLLGVGALLALGWGWRFCRAGLTDAERRNTRFLALGAVGALVPVVGSFPSTRLTIAAFLGISPLFALIVREAAGRLRALPALRSPRLAARFVGLALVVGVVFHTQLHDPLQWNVQGQVDGFATTSQWVLAAEVDPARVAAQRVFLLAGDEFTTTFFFSYIWAHAGRPLPRSYYPITACPCAHFVLRTADNELLLRAVGGPYLASGDENMFHSPRRLWREGEVVELDGLRVRAEEVLNGSPGALRLTFAHSVDDPDYVFLSAGPFGIVRIPLPAQGQRILLKRASTPNWIELERHRFLSRVAPIPEMLFFGSYPPFLLFKPQ